MYEEYLVIGLMIVGFLIYKLVSNYIKRYKEKFRETAMKIGLEYINKKDESLVKDISACAIRGFYEYVPKVLLSGKRSGTKWKIFKQAVNTGGKNQTNYLVYMAECSLPEFLIFKNTWSNKFSFANKRKYLPKIELGLGISEKFFIRSKDKSFLLKRTSLFNDDMKWIIDSLGDKLLIYRECLFISPSKIEEEFKEVEKIYRMFS